MPLNVTAGFCSELICHVTLAQKRLVVLASKAAFVCACTLKFMSFLSCQAYCATKKQSQKNLVALVPLQQVEVFCHDDDDISDNGKLNTE